MDINKLKDGKWHKFSDSPTSIPIISHESRPVEVVYLRSVHYRTPSLTEFYIPEMSGMILQLEYDWLSKQSNIRLININKKNNE